VGSPAEGIEKNKCGINPNRKLPKSTNAARFTERSILANADIGDLGDKMLTWIMNRINRRIVELLTIRRGEEEEEGTDSRK